MDQFSSPPPLPDEEREATGGRRRQRRRTGLLAGIAGVAAVAAALAIGLTVALTPHAGGAVPSTPRQSSSSFTVMRATPLATPASKAAIEARVDPGLVNINVANRSRGFRGAATGMVLTPSGVVLTNNHVIQGSTSITATDVGNGRTYTASVVGYSRSADVAVIQLHGAGGLKTVPLGDSSTVTVGTRVIALGNAGGGGGTPRVASGRVVGLGRTIVASDLGGGNAERLAGLIQTNAAVLPGDSGGPLVNSTGQVVGMDAAASSSNGSYQAEGPGPQSFAIPIDSALSIARQIEVGPASPGVHVGPTGFLGVAVVPSSPSGGFGSPANQTPGALIGGVLRGYPAAKTGLAQGDVITSVDGKSVTSASGLTDLLSAYHPGDSVHLRWIDPSGQAHTATVTLASGPPA